MRKTNIVLAACLAAMAATPATADLLGANEFEDCLLTNEGLTCEPKTATAFSVSFDRSVIAEFVFPDTTDPPQIEATAQVELSKSRPTFTFPLLYHHTVDYDPRESPGALRFDGYLIGEPSLDYGVKVEWKTQDPPGIETSEFVLSPEEPVYAPAADPGFQGDFLVAAKLVGDVAAYKVPPALDNFILYIPSSPADHPFVQHWQFNTLLVPREEVSHEGTECDKVGYIARTPLARKYGFCLHHQLIDKHNADLLRLNENPDLETRYLVAGMRAFKRTEWFGPGLVARQLSYELLEVQRTQVVLVTDRALAVRQISTESDGEIVEAEALVDPFQSHSRDGSLLVRISNSGDFKADYFVEVTDCDTDIVPGFPAQVRSLEPFEEAVLYFDLYTARNSDAMDHACTVTLKSPRDTIYDQTEAVFGTAFHPAP